MKLIMERQTRRKENDLADILRIIQHYYDLEFDEIVEFHYDTIPMKILINL